MESSSGPPPPRTPLSLSLTLGGPFGRNEELTAARGDEVEDGGGVLQPGEVAEIRSENMGQGSQSGGAWSGEEAGHEDAGGSKKRKGYYRHSPEQTCFLETAFKKSPNPNEAQRQQLSQKLGLSPRQVKYWFQNKRSQIKITQERQVNSLLKTQLDQLEKDNRALREFINSSGFPTQGVAAATNTDELLLLRLENAKLKAEVESLHRALANNAAAALLTSPSTSTGGIQIRSRSSLDYYVGVGHDDDKTKFLVLASRALDELMAMCSGQPLWVRSAETGRDVLNYDEYARLFRHHHDYSGDRRAVWPVEASRATGVVTIDAAKLVGAFVDVNQWKEMFPSMITKASTLEVIHAGDNDHLDGIVQLMSAEVQAPTPLVPARKLHFLRHCRKLGAEKWAIVDVSLDNYNFEPGAQTSSSSSTPCMCLKMPSGCIVEETNIGRLCKVTWVEHAKYREAAVPSMHRAVTESGLAFGARRCVAALQLQCERMVFSVATHVPTRDLRGIESPSDKRSALKVAEQMTSSLYRAIGASRHLPRSKAPNDTRDIRVMSRRSTGKHGEPQGLILCAVMSVWLPVHPAVLFGFLRDELRRHEWDTMLPAGGSIHPYVAVRKGDNSGNCFTAYVHQAVQSFRDDLSRKWILQDTSTSPCESTISYAPVDAMALYSMVYGHDSSAVTVLPCGFVVMPDGLGARPPVITSRREAEVDRTTVESGGSLVTLVFQVLATSSVTAAVETATQLVSGTLANIKTALRCGD